MKRIYMKPACSMAVIAEEDILRTSYGHQASGIGDLREWKEEEDA